MTDDVSPSSLYMDHASTSWPKSDAMIEAMIAFARSVAGSPGRSGHQSAAVAQMSVEAVRAQISQLVKSDSRRDVAFMHNATAALNAALLGVLHQGDHVLVSTFEHNSVMRPLERLKRLGTIDFDIVPPGSDCALIDLSALERLMRRDTRLVVVNHMSNVTGEIAPLNEICTIAHATGALVLVDGSQSVGLIPIDMKGMGIDFLAFTGHKSLHGPTGTGGLIVLEPELIDAVITGGTGGNSASAVQPGVAPEKFEAGTMNSMGVVALGAAIAELAGADGTSFIPPTRASRVATEVRRLLEQTPGVRVVGGVNDRPRGPLVSFNVEGLFPGEVAALLEDRRGIAVRAGLHCAPGAHRALGTFPHGTVRASFGPQHDLNDARILADAVGDLRL